MTLTSSIPTWNPRISYSSIMLIKLSHTTATFRLPPPQSSATPNTAKSYWLRRFALSTSDQPHSMTNITHRLYRHATTARRKSFSTLAGASRVIFGVSAAFSLSSIQVMLSSRRMTTLNTWRWWSPCVPLRSTDHLSLLSWPRSVAHRPRTQPHSEWSRKRLIGIILNNL